MSFVCLSPHARQQHLHAVGRTAPARGPEAGPRGGAPLARCTPTHGDLRNVPERVPSSTLNSCRPDTPTTRTG